MDQSMSSSPDSPPNSPPGCPADCPPLPEGYQLYGYRIERMLSRGGFSIAYMASDSAGTPVVVKEYLPIQMAQRAAGSQALIVSSASQGKFNHGMRSCLEEAR